jgi:hypothetical protein
MRSATASNGGCRSCSKSQPGFAQHSKRSGTTMLQPAATCTRATAKPVVKTLSRSDPVNPRGRSAVTLAQPNAVDGDDATPDTPVHRIIHQLRQELAAGLRGG